MSALWPVAGAHVSRADTRLAGTSTISRPAFGPAVKLALTCCRWPLMRQSAARRAVDLGRLEFFEVGVGAEVQRRVEEDFVDQAMAKRAQADLVAGLCSNHRSAEGHAEFEVVRGLRFEHRGRGTETVLVGVAMR